jgi:hypothetical protein
VYNIQGRLDDWYFDLPENEDDFSLLGHRLRGKINGNEVTTDIVLGRVMGLSCVLTHDEEAGTTSFYELGEPLCFKRFISVKI